MEPQVSEATVIRMHERLDAISAELRDLVSSVSQLTVLNERISRHAEDMNWLREEFAKRDVRAEVIKSWGEEELKALSNKLAAQHLEIETAKAYSSGVAKVVGIIAIVISGISGVVYNSFANLLDKTDRIIEDYKTFKSDMQYRNSDYERKFKEYDIIHSLERRENRNGTNSSTTP